MPRSRAVLRLALVALAGLAAGFLSYRLTQPRLGPGASVRPLAAAAPAVPAPAEPATDTDAEAAAPPRVVPSDVPDMSFPDPAGVRHSLHDYVGHPLIINFWATWCEPCRREMPLLGRLRRQYHRDGLQIVGVAVDFGQAVRAFLHTTAVPYPVLIAEQDGLGALGQFGMEPVLPFSVFADRQGRIVAVKAGELHPEEAGDILAAIHAIDSGQLALPAAREQIGTELAALAAKRARAQHNSP
jgi:thiol-disulfide isomerase/thioredoxin